MAATLFSKQLTLLLARLGMTKYRLARLSGLSPSYVGFLASGDRSPSVEALKKLAPVLQVDLDELKAWVEASRLGETGLEGLRRHLHLDAGGPQSVIGALLGAMTAFAGCLAADDPAETGAIDALLAALREATGAVGVMLWQAAGAEGPLRATHHVGMPSEYVAIANLRLKEQGLEPGERFPVIDAFTTGEPAEVGGLLGKPEHGLHFYARTLGFDRLHVHPISRSGAPLGALALYLPERPLIDEAAMGPWLDHAAALLALAIGPTR